MLNKIIIAIALLLPINIFAQISDNIENEFKEKLQNVCNDNKTIQCDFIKNKKVKNISKITESNGKFYYDNAGLMAMHYNQPAGDKIIMNKDKFMIFNAGKKMGINAASNPMMAQISYMMQACMSGDVSKLGSGWDMAISKNHEGYTIILKPTERRIKKYISAMVMEFCDDTLTLDRLKIEETSGGYTEYLFSHKRLNDTIDNTYFTIE